jgi:exonuclease VII small subunit
VKRAAELITYCRQKLHSTEAEVRKIIAQMDTNRTAPPNT